MHTRYAVRYGGRIVISRDRAKLAEDQAKELEVRDFMGNLMNRIETVDEMILPMMENDGFKIVDLDN